MIRSLAEAIAFFDQTMSAHPERDGLAAEAAALRGERRRYPSLSLNYLNDPTDTGKPEFQFELPKVEIDDPVEAGLAQQIVGMLGPLRLLNPVRPVFGLGEGPGTMVTGFGIPLDPQTGNSPAFTKTIRQVLAEPPPDPAAAGRLPALREQIERIKEFVPPRFKIALPDMQGPFNLAHSIVGEEAMTGPGDDPSAFHALMERITSFWLAARQALLEWIGDDYVAPGQRETARIAECSVNLVSTDFYRQFVLPHDLQIARAHGSLGIHPCSGPHVFRVTLDSLPNVVETEAGWIARTAAGSISVDDALAAIGERPVLLRIGQELPEGEEYDFICRDLERYAAHPRLLFGYTGMHWRIRDIPCICALHRQLDGDWDRREQLA